MVILYKGIYGVLFDDSCYSTGDDTEISRSHPQASSTRKGTTSEVSKEVQARWKQQFLNKQIPPKYPLSEHGDGSILR